MLPQKMEFTSLSDALISLIPIYGPWIIFGIVGSESAGVPLPGETILVGAALLAATTGQINIVVVVLAAAAGAIVGTVWDTWSGVGSDCPFFADTVGTSA